MQFLCIVPHQKHFENGDFLYLHHHAQFFLDGGEGVGVA
jgi:hypothetical protein